MILDTNALSSMLGLDGDFLRSFSSVSVWEIPAVVLGEYRFGLKKSRYRAALERAVDKLERTEQVLPVTAATARHYSAIREELRVKGRPIPMNDLWIAALAREHGLTVVTRDAHFQSVAGMVTRGW